MTDDKNDGLDEIVSFCSDAPPRVPPSERRYFRLSSIKASGIELWVERISKEPINRGRKLRFAGVFLVLLVGMLLAFATLTIIVPAGMSAPVDPTPPQPPPPPAKLPAPFHSELPVSLPFEKPAGFSQLKDGDGQTVQPQYTLTQTIQPVVTGATIPNILVVLIGLAVVEKIRVKKRSALMKVAAGPLPSGE